MSVTDRYDMTLAVKVKLNSSTINQGWKLGIVFRLRCTIVKMIFLSMNMLGKSLLDAGLCCGVVEIPTRSLLIQN